VNLQFKAKKNVNPLIYSTLRNGNMLAEHCSTPNGELLEEMRESRVEEGLAAGLRQYSESWFWFPLPNFVFVQRPIMCFKIRPPLRPECEDFFFVSVLFSISRQTIWDLWWTK
jgi:hypothetical protein